MDKSDTRNNADGVPDDPHGSDAPDLKDQAKQIREAARGPLLSKRNLLIAVGGAATTALVGSSSLSDEDEGMLSVGTAALNEAYHVAGGLYVGPESALSTVDPKAGRYYLAADTDKEFYGDGSAWQWQGVNAPTVQADEATITKQLNKPAVTTAIGEERSYNTAIKFVDRHSGTPYEGIAIGPPDYYWEPPYRPGIGAGGDRFPMPDHSGDGTASGSGRGNPAGTEICGILNDFIFAVGESPLTLYRSPYSNSFDSGSFSWTQVFTGAPDSGIQLLAGEYIGAFGVNRDTGTLLVGEEFGNATSTSAKMYRSADNGLTWTEVYATDGSVQNEYHCIAKDPYVDDRWVATVGDAGNKRFLESTDDGLTWTRRDYGLTTNSQAVGMGFDSERMYFVEDRGVYEHGPWYVERENPESDDSKGMLCSEHPKHSFRDLITDGLEYSVHTDTENEVIYVMLHDTGGSNKVLYYIDGIGGVPKMLMNSNFNRLQVGEGRVFSGDKSIPLVQR